MSHVKEFFARRLALLLIVPLCLLAVAMGLVKLLYCILFGPARAWELALAHDQLANTALNGNADETISSRAGRARREGKLWGCILCRWLDLFDKDHCEKFIEWQFFKDNK